MREWLKEWWKDRCDIIHIAFGVAFSELYVRLIILDHGLDFSIKLPHLLNKMNPITWLTKCVFHAVLMLFGLYDRISVHWFWKFSKWKGLELEIMDKYYLFSFNYHWEEHCDHWGHRAEIAVAGLEASLWYYDSRHWDDTTDAPQIYPDEEDNRTKDSTAIA